MITEGKRYLRHTENEPQKGYNSLFLENNHREQSNDTPPSPLANPNSLSSKWLCFWTWRIVKWQWRASLWFQWETKETRHRVITSQVKEYCYIEESEWIQSSRHRTGLRSVTRLCANHDSIPLSRITDPMHTKLTQSPLSVLREGRSVMNDRNQSHFASSVSSCSGRVLPCSSFDSLVHLHRRKPGRIGWIGDKAYLNQNRETHPPSNETVWQ